MVVRLAGQCSPTEERDREHGGGRLRRRAGLDDLPTDLFSGDQSVADVAGKGLGELVGKPLSDIEGMFIAETLQFTGGNREEAASLLGIGERTLYRKIKEYQL